MLAAITGVIIVACCICTMHDARMHASISSKRHFCDLFYFYIIHLYMSDYLESENGHGTADFLDSDLIEVAMNRCRQVTSSSC